MPSKISNRRVSSLAGLDREMIRELCDLHPWDMGQLCEAVALNKSAFSNFLTGRRPLPEKFAPQFLRQIGLTIKGEMDPRHCFYFAVGPGRQDFAGKWISRLFPRGGDMWTIVSQEQFQKGEDEVEIDVYELGVLLCCDDKVAIVRDDVNFGDVSWIPGDWKNVGTLLSGNRLLNTSKLPTKETVFKAMYSAEPPDPKISWEVVQAFAEKTGFTARDVMTYFENALRARALNEP